MQRCREWTKKKQNDIVRTLRRFSRNSRRAERPQIERAMARAAVDSKDDRRTVPIWRIRAGGRGWICAVDRGCARLRTMGGREEREKSLKDRACSSRNMPKDRRRRRERGAQTGRARSRSRSRLCLRLERKRGLRGEDADRGADRVGNLFHHPSEEAARESSEALGSFAMRKKTMCCGWTMRSRCRMRNGGHGSLGDRRQLGRCTASCIIRKRVWET